MRSASKQFEYLENTQALICTSLNQMFGETTSQLVCNDEIKSIFAFM